jgi:hypothetical protein
MEAVMDYDSWLTYNPALDGIEQDVEMYYECENVWAKVINGVQDDWQSCDFADTIELPDTWVSVSGVASGELTCPKCGVVETFEFDMPKPEDDRGD